LSGYSVFIQFCVLVSFVLPFPVKATKLLLCHHPATMLAAARFDDLPLFRVEGNYSPQACNCHVSSVAPRNEPRNDLHLLELTRTQIGHSACRRLLAALQPNALSWPVCPASPHTVCGTLQSCFALLPRLRLSWMISSSLAMLAP
jgi:hypothetical protein